MLLGWIFFNKLLRRKGCNPEKTRILQGKLIFSYKILRKEDWCYWVAMYVKEIIQGRLQWEPMLLQRVVLHWQAESFNMRMLSRSLSDCRSLLLNLYLNLNRCLCLCSDCSDFALLCSALLCSVECSEIKRYVTQWVTRSPIELSWTPVFIRWEK